MNILSIGLRPSGSFANDTKKLRIPSSAIDDLRRRHE
jgi:hypothetical protein